MHSLTANESSGFAGYAEPTGSAEPRIPTQQVPARGYPQAEPPAQARESVETAGPSRRRIVLAAAAVAVLAAVVAIGVYATAGDVPRGTRVLGADVGGMSRAEARQTLTGHLGPRASRPVRVNLAGTAFEMSPEDADLRFDIAATVDKAAQGGPRLFGRRDVAPVTQVDGKRLEAALRQRLDSKLTTTTNPAITYDGLTPKVVYGKPGSDLDPVAAAGLVRSAWLGGEVADIPLAQRPPAMTAEQVDAMVANVAAPAVAAPVTVNIGGTSLSLSPQIIAKSLVFTSDAAGRLAPAIDEKKLRSAAGPELAKVEVRPKNAGIILSGGTPKVVAGVAGTVVDTAKLGTDLITVLPAAANRQVAGTLRPAKAEVTDAAIAKLGIKEKVSTFTTRFTGGLSSPRSQNIVTIAKTVDGSLVKPGATFSLNRHTGERTYGKGYKDAPVIVDGKLEPGVAGGASQFTTTLFNAAYYAGLQDVEHKPHSFYFSRYPAVIEATIFYPALDLKFKNTTPYGMLIDTSYTSSSVTVSMWSTKYYDSVVTQRSPRRDVTSPSAVYRKPGSKCIATDGLPGFTQDAYRVIRKDGKQIKRDKFTWRYDPEPRFICGPGPAAE